LDQIQIADGIRKGPLGIWVAPADKREWEDNNKLAVVGQEVLNNHMLRPLELHRPQ